MVDVLPGPGCVLESLNLAATRQFLLRGLGQKAAAPAASHKRVDVLKQLQRENDMCPSGIHIPVGRVKPTLILKNIWDLRQATEASRPEPGELFLRAILR